MPIDKAGENAVPDLSLEDIAGRAEAFLARFDAECLQRPLSTPLGTICTKLRAEYGLPIDLSADLGYSSAGYRIVGQFDYRSRGISIDRTMTPNTLDFAFSLAHEIGHLVLHRKLGPTIFASLRQDPFEDGVNQFQYDRAPTSAPGDLIEWQANKFAGALLMPRPTVKLAVQERQQERGITRGFGRVWVDWRGQALGDLNDMLKFLSERYQVPEAVANVRLRELGILVEETPPNGLRHIRDVFRGE
jgi:hypothetical protein